MVRVLSVVFAAFALGAAVPAAAEMIGGNPGPAHNYVCPNADGKGPLDCYFDAIPHLYTMCKHVKSIEIIEHGYEKAESGVNGAKSEFCTVKQRINIVRPYNAALKEAAVSRQAVDAVRSLQDYWLSTLDQLSIKSGESDEDYKARTARPFEVFQERIEGIRKIVTVVKEHTTVAAPTKAGRDKKDKR